MQGETVKFERYQECKYTIHKL